MCIRDSPEAALGPGRDGGYRAGHPDGSDRVSDGVLVLQGTDFQAQKRDGYLEKFLWEMGTAGRSDIL